MNYLARLKQLESGEIFHHAPKPEPTKPTEPPFDGFVGSIPGVNENIYIATSAEKPGIVAALKSSSRVIAEAQSLADELARLVHLCGERYQFTADEHAEALAIALADPYDALTCFRAMAGEPLSANL